MVNSQQDEEGDVADEEFESIMRLSNAEAISDVNNIWQKVQLIRTRTSKRLENLAKVQLCIEQEPEQQESNSCSSNRIHKLNIAYEHDRKQLKALTILDGKTFGDRHRELLASCKKIMQPYGIPVYEFSKSWQDGHAFCALIHSFRSDLIEEKYLKCKDPTETLTFVEGVINSLGVHFEGNFVKHMKSKNPNFVKTCLFILKLYNCLNAENQN